MIKAIIASILKIIENLTNLFLNRSKNTDISDNEMSKKLNGEKDKYNKLINKALKGDKEAADEIRKHISL